MTARGLRLNGRSFLLRSKVIEPTCMDTEMQQMRQAGFNSVFATSSGITSDLRRLGDRLGLLLSYDWPDKSSTSAWIVPSLDVLVDSGLQNRNARQASNESSDPLLPPNASVKICHEDELSSLREDALPKIVLTKHLPNSLLSRPDIIGWIERA